MRRHTRNLQVNEVENRECWGLSNEIEGRGLQLNLQEGGGEGALRIRRLHSLDAAAVLPNTAAAAAAAASRHRRSHHAWVHRSLVAGGSRHNSASGAGRTAGGGTRVHRAAVGSHLADSPAAARGRPACAAHSGLPSVFHLVL